MSRKNGWLRNSSRALSTMLVMISATSLSGCAVSPLVSWPRPGQTTSPLPLADAQRYAEEARKAYREARDKHVQATTGLNSGLLGLGVLGTAFAVAKAHRDALLGTAFVGASAYAFGQQNLNGQHLLVYEAGIEAIGCAKDAMRPLAMSIGDRAALEAAMIGLDRALVKTSSARAHASAALAAWQATDPEKNDLETVAGASIAASGTSIDVGLVNVTSGRLLIRRADEAGDTLVSAVERIDDAVNKAVTATLPDPSSVFKVIAGLPGFAAGIVPGSDAAISAAITKSSAGLTPEVAPQAGQLGKGGAVNFNQGAALYRAIAALDEATDGLRLALANVNGRLPTEESLKGLQSVKDCGLSDVSFAMKVVPAAPSITAGADRKTSFTISGGTPPYHVDLQVTPVKGVTLVSPKPVDKTAFFEITKDAMAGTVPVVVMDASKPSKTMVLSVEVLKSSDAGAGAPDNTPAPEAGKLKAPANAAVLADRLNGIKVFKRKDGGEFSITTPATRKSDTLVEIGLRCKPPPKSGICIPSAEATQTLADAASAPGMAKLLNIAPLAGCICAH